jgi:hypothetical protein
MKMKTKLFLTLFLLSFLTPSCKDETNTINEREFPSTHNLHAQRIKTNEGLSISRFFIKNSKVFTKNNREDSILIVYSYPDFHCINSWGIIGKGPYEFLSPHFIDIPNSDSIYVIDFWSKSVGTLNTKNLSYNRVRSFKYDYDLPQRIYYSSDSLLIFTTFQNDVIVRKMNWFDEISTVFTPERISLNHPNGKTHYGYIGVNDSLKRIVYAYKHYRRFDIIDYNGTVLKTVNIKPSITPDFNPNRENDFEKAIIYYRGVRTTNSSFFLQFIGMSFTDATSTNNVYTYIEEYNWEGKPLSRYKLQQGFIWEFDVIRDPNGHVEFIGIDQGHESPFIVFKQKIEE